MYYYNGAQRYEQFLQVGWLYRALILLSLALFRAPLCLRSSWCYICIYFFCLHPSLYLLVSWAWWDWPLTWLTNHCPSVLWHCWLGHVTRKIVSEMTYNVSSGTLNSTIPYHTIVHQTCLEFTWILVVSYSEGRLFHITNLINGMYLAHSVELMNQIWAI